MRHVLFAVGGPREKNTGREEDRKKEESRW